MLDVITNEYNYLRASFQGLACWLPHARGAEGNAAQSPCLSTYLMTHTTEQEERNFLGNHLLQLLYLCTLKKTLSQISLKVSFADLLEHNDKADSSKVIPVSK